MIWTVNSHAVADLAQIAECEHALACFNLFGIVTLTLAEYPTAAKQTLSSKINTQNLQTQLSFKLPYCRDGVMDVAADLTKDFKSQ